MVSAKLVDERDAQSGKKNFFFFLQQNQIFILILVTSTMIRLVENPSLTSVTFALVSFFSLDLSINIEFNFF